MTAQEMLDRVWDVQQECARLDFTTRGEDATAKWVAGELSALLAEVREQQKVAGE